jgi:hypothetical protein
MYIYCSLSPSSYGKLDAPASPTATTRSLPNLIVHTGQLVRVKSDCEDRLFPAAGRPQTARNGPVFGCDTAQNHYYNRMTW